MNVLERILVRALPAAQLASAKELVHEDLEVRICLTMVALGQFFTFLLNFRYTGCLLRFGFSTHGNCRHGNFLFDFPPKTYIFYVSSIFGNFEPYMDRTIHIFWYVELNMDRTVHISWYILSYIWTVRSILSGMLTYMDPTVHIMFVIWVIC